MDAYSCFASLRARSKFRWRISHVHASDLQPRERPQPRCEPHLSTIAVECKQRILWRDVVYPRRSVLRRVLKNLRPLKYRTCIALCIRASAYFAPCIYPHTCHFEHLQGNWRWLDFRSVLDTRGLFTLDVSISISDHRPQFFINLHSSEIPLYRACAAISGRLHQGLCQGR